MSSQLTNRKKADDGSTVSWLNIQCIQFTNDSPQVMKFKSVCDAEAQWLSVDFRKRMRHSDGLQMQLVPSTCEQRKLNKHKVSDLLSLKPFIPPIYHTFYDSLQPDTAVDEILEAENEMLINSEDEFVDTLAFHSSSHNSEKSCEHQSSSVDNHEEIGTGSRRRCSFLLRER